MSIFALFGPLGLLIVVAAWLHYLSLIPKEAVPKFPHGHKVAMGAGTAVAVLGSKALGPAGILLAATAAGLALFFLWLLREGPLPDGAPTFAVGGTIPPFSVKDGQGRPVTREAFSNQRIFLKFFRGHW